jgi:predicted nucleic acid-binding protein
VLVAPAGQPAALRRAREAIAALGITPYAPTEAIAVEAARARQRHPISLPDAYALATARHAGGRLQTFDRTLLQAAIAEGLA